MVLADIDDRPIGDIPFRGSLPGIRFAAGAVLFVTGLAGFFGLQTGLDWLVRGAEGWIEVCAISAYAFMACGALMMAAWSPIARQTCWILMCTVGFVSLLHHWSIWSGTSLGPLSALLGEDDPPMKSVAAFLILVTGIRIWSATQSHQVAPLLDGIILGIAVASLLGYLSGFEPLYVSSVFGGISVLESIGFLAMGVLFLLADIEYARLNLRARRLPAALGIASFAAIVSLRISEAVLDSLGHRGFEGLLAGDVGVGGAVLALGATNTLMSVSIGAAAMLLIVTYDTATAGARRESALRIRAEADLARVSRTLDAALNTLAGVEGPVGGPVHPILDRSEVDLADLTDAVLATRGQGQRGGPRVLKARAAGRVFADRGWLAQALRQLIDEAVADTAGGIPLLSLRLDREHDRSIVRLSFGGTTKTGPYAETPGAGSTPNGADDRSVSHALGLADAVARWHGGSFWVTTTGSASTFHIALPDSGAWHGVP
jgi:hypothetical protein